MNWPYRMPAPPPADPAPPEDAEDATTTFETALRAQGRRNERLRDVLRCAALLVSVTLLVLDLARYVKLWTR